ncbi:hypothetical protein TSOC_007023, partial [Tetrabaena socialis]
MQHKRWTHEWIHGGRVAREGAWREGKDGRLQDEVCLCAAAGRWQRGAWRPRQWALACDGGAAAALGIVRRTALGAQRRAATVEPPEGSTHPPGSHKSGGRGAGAGATGKPGPGAVDA